MCIATIPEGLYTIRNRNTNLYVDVNAFGTANGTPLVQWHYHGGNNQVFWIKPLGNNEYSITPLHVNKLLTVENASTGNNQRIILHDPNNSVNQRFRFHQVDSNSFYSIRTAHTDYQKCVTILSNNAAANVVQRDYNGNADEHWVLSNVGLPPLFLASFPVEGVYRIKNVHSNLTMDVEGWGTDRRTPLQQWEHHGGSNQLFWLKHESNGAYSITPMHARTQNRIFDIPSASNANGAQLQIYDRHVPSEAHQRFKFEQLDVFTPQVRILTGSSGYTKCITVQSQSTANGANLLQWDYGGLASDHWVLEHIPVMNVNVIYDQAFRDRRGSNNNTWTWINTALTGYNTSGRSIQQMMVMEFGVFMNFNVVTTAQASLLTQVNCNHASNRNALCFNTSTTTSYNCTTVPINSGQWVTEARCLATHHKSDVRMLERITLLNGIPTTHVNLAFTGHNTCFAWGNTSSLTDWEHIVGGSWGADGITMQAWNTAMIMTNPGVPNSSDALSNNQIKMVVLHELLHLFSAPDHYGGASLGERDNCIFGNNMYSQNNFQLCNDCRNTIQANINRYNHHTVGLWN